MTFGTAWKYSYSDLKNHAKNLLLHLLNYFQNSWYIELLYWFLLSFFYKKKYMKIWFMKILNGKPIGYEIKVRWRQINYLYSPYLD